MSKDLTYSLSFSAPLDATSLPIDLSLNFGLLAALTTSSTIQLTPTVQGALTFGAHLGAEAAELTADSDAPADGVLTGEATFALAVGTLAPVTVTVPAVASNSSLDDLVGDINAAGGGAIDRRQSPSGMQGARLTLTTTAQTDTPFAAYGRFR